MLRKIMLRTVILGLLLAIILPGSLPGAKAAWQVRVPGSAGWVATGLSMTPNQPLTFSTKGIAITGPLRDFPGARSGPDGQPTVCSTIEGSPCALDGAPYGALIGRIGPGGTPFVMGALITLNAPATGELFLAVNDNVDFYADNAGSFIVRLR